MTREASRSATMSPLALAQREHLRVDLERGLVVALEDRGEPARTRARRARVSSGSESSTSCTTSAIDSAGVRPSTRISGLARAQLGQRVDEPADRVRAVGEEGMVLDHGLEHRQLQAAHLRLGRVGEQPVGEQAVEQRGDDVGDDHVGGRERARHLALGAMDRRRALGRHEAVRRGDTRRGVGAAGSRPAPRPRWWCSAPWRLPGARAGGSRARATRPAARGGPGS